MRAYTPVRAVLLRPGVTSGSGSPSPSDGWHDCFASALGGCISSHRNYRRRSSIEATAKTTVIGVV